ncbi:MAG: GH-E family nuclease, partial [Roseburia faecis]
GCIRTNGSTCEGTGSPEKKSFRSEHGKGMDLYPQRMGLDGGETGKITFEDETGTTIESNGGLVLMAKEGIRLESMTGIAMQGMSDIMALYAEGASSLCVNGSVDMLGRLAGISASKYTGYPPYDDAPKEGEFDWEGFTRNLAIGLGVVAVCAIGAAISIATLGAGSILAGAFIGAGIGALSTTAMKAGEEISNGNVRSAKEAFRDVGISAASGFITGAFGAKFPGAHRLAEGVVDTAVSAGERLAYAVFDDSMSWDEKWAYAFDPGQMVADFVTGVVIGEILDGIMAATQNKLRSIFANSDEMRRALDSGNKTKPYANSRPSFRKGVVEEVWENAKGPDGLVRDPNTGDIINWTPGQSRKGVWDMGHIPEAKYSEMHEAYMNGELTTKEFVDWYNDPANYRPELPSNNRSHKYE